MLPAVLPAILCGGCQPWIAQPLPLPARLNLQTLMEGALWLQERTFSHQLHAAAGKGLRASGNVSLLAPKVQLALHQTQELYACCSGMLGHAQRAGALRDSWTTGGRA